MKAINQAVLFGLLLGVASPHAMAAGKAGPAPSEPEMVSREAGSWDSVGDPSANTARAGASPRARDVAAARDGLQARKSEMVRRMFWIMLAHR